jgi:Ser/Thr protein kinase RdoA (MazF antagonist)
MRDDTFLLQNNSGRFWLYRYLNGDTLDKLLAPDVSKVAEMMAAYHGLIEGSHLNNNITGAATDFRSLVLTEIEEYRSALIPSSSLNEVDKIFRKESQDLLHLADKLDLFELSKLRRYPLHRDIGPENLIWRDSDVVGLIDLENVGAYNEPIVKDIAVFFQHSCRPIGSDTIDLRLCRVFLERYTKLHPLSEIETAALPDLMAAGFIEDFAYAYWMLKNDPARAKKYRLILYSKLAKWCYENREKITQLGN